MYSYVRNRPPWLGMSCLPTQMDYLRTNNNWPLSSLVLTLHILLRFFVYHKWIIKSMVIVSKPTNVYRFYRQFPQSFSFYSGFKIHNLIKIIPKISTGCTKTKLKTV